MKNKTFTIIKPNAVQNKTFAKILDVINENNFNIVELKMVQLSKKEASLFYQEHKERSFFDDLINFITSGKVIVGVLEKENAVEEFRTLIGDTDPLKSSDGTIRKLYGESKEKNSIHGSDSDESAKREIAFFFN